MPARHKSKRSKNKADTQRKHAMRRFTERFSKELRDCEYDLIIKHIQTNQAKFIEKQSNRLSVFKVRVENINAFAVYDKQRKTIVTFINETMAIEGNGPIII
jgi:hypothetical protein